MCFGKKVAGSTSSASAKENSQQRGSLNCRESERAVTVPCSFGKQKSCTWKEVRGYFCKELE